MKEWCTRGVVREGLSKTRASGFVGVWLSVALLGCSDDDEPVPAGPNTCLDADVEQTEVPDLPLVYATEHIDIYMEEGGFLCAGSAQDYERFVVYVAEHSGVDVQRRIPLYLIADVSDWCPPGAVACNTGDGVLLSVPYATYHELGHAVICQERSTTPSFLAEGFAVSFEPTKNEEIGNPSEIAEIRQGDFGPYYSLAGHFVRWLQEEFGPDTFLQLYTHASYKTGVWAAVEAAYGASVESDYHATAPAMWVPHRQCADVPLLEPNNGVWEFEATLDCEDPSTLGPYERISSSSATFERRAMYQSFLIEIETPGTYLFKAPSETSVVHFDRCLDEHPATEAEIDENWVQRSVWFIPGEDQGTAELAHAGLWRVDVLREHGPPVDVWVTIEPDPG